LIKVEIRLTPMLFVPCCSLVYLLRLAWKATGIAMKTEENRWELGSFENVETHYARTMPEFRLIKYQWFVNSSRSIPNDTVTNRGMEQEII